jgi:hypothetical protein
VSCFEPVGERLVHLTDEPYFGANTMARRHINRSPTIKIIYGKTQYFLIYSTASQSDITRN